MFLKDVFDLYTNQNNVGCEIEFSNQLAPTRSNAKTM